MYIQLFAVFVFLQLLDGYLTHRGLQLANTRELNPILQAVMSKIGVLPTLILTKGIMIAAFWEFRDSIHPGALVFLIVVYSYVCFQNWKVIDRYKA